MNAEDGERLRASIKELEFQLESQKAVLRTIDAQRKPSVPNGDKNNLGPILSKQKTVSLPISPSLTHMLLLSDSALPVGSFAYSSGLESFLIHNKAKATTSTTQGTTPNTLSLFKDKFLALSIQSIAHTQVPYVLAAFRDPLGLMELDNDIDASTPCTVARRASIAQGRALLTVWGKAFASACAEKHPDENLEAATAISTFAHDLKIAAVSKEDHPIVSVNGHMAPIWGAVCNALGLNLEEAGFLFLLNHAKAVISASVRAGVMGPYMAQSILASMELQELIRKCLEAVWFTQPEDAGQVVPLMDLWVGRHELLYSRIFNS